MFEISKGAKTVLDILYSNGYEGYIVGGATRDMIMGIPVNDFDITTNALPEENLKIFKDFRVIETGIKHGTVTVVVDKENVEITTYRTDGEYKDNRHPENVSFTRSLARDLGRRDFTINARAYDGKGKFIDLFGGKEDIQNKIIRAIGEPEKRFEEDALRILRAVRFSSTLGFEIEPDTKKAMEEKRHLLKNISKERIAAEINKFLCGKNVKNAILENVKVLSVIIPEIAEMENFSQNNPHHVYDLLTHTAIVTEKIPPVKHLRLSAFLHDTGKLKTYKEDEKGIAHFYSHAKESEKIATLYLNNYKYDNETKEKVLTLIVHHDEVIQNDRIFIKKRISRLGKEMFFDLLEIKKADNYAQSPQFYRIDEIESIKKTAEDIVNSENCFSIKDLNINGSDLIKIGISEGKQIGEMLSYLFGEVIEEKIPNEKELLLQKAKQLSNK